MIEFRKQIIALIIFSISHNSFATFDVESPDEILAFIRMLMIVPEVSNEIVRLGELGCVWDDQVIWGGSPSEENIATGIFWKNLDMKFVNSSEQEMWVSFAFSSKDQELIEVKNVTDVDKMIDCTE